MMKTKHPAQYLKIDTEFKSLIPSLKSDEYAGLEKRILEEGCRDPLVAWGDIIVDGHNRYEICQKHNLSFLTVLKEFRDRPDVKIWIIRNQLCRRNLTDFEKSELALKIEPLLKEEAEKNKILHLKQFKNTVRLKSAERRNPIDTKDELAKTAGVSRDTITKVKRIKNQAVPEIEQAVRDKKLSINTAATLAELPPDEQKQIAVLSKNEIIKKAQELRGESKHTNSKEAAASEHILKSFKASIDTILTYTKDDPVFTKKLRDFLATNLSGIKKLTAFLPLDAKAEFGMSLLKEARDTVKAGDKVDEATLGIFKKAKKICSSVENPGATGSSQADPRVKDLTDWYYQLWNNNPPEKVNGNGGGRVAKIFSGLLDVLESRKVEAPADYIKNLYAYYKSASPGLLMKKEEQWLFGDSVKSLVKFRAKFADIEVHYLKKKGGYSGNSASPDIVGGEKGHVEKKGALGFPQHILDRNKSSGIQAPKT